ncbi:MAG: GNAT family N-acetyltransferase [Firmicutes bacterium]|nr:GNAT family N-acetyltransferase [Bacillota bacterium]
MINLKTLKLEEIDYDNKEHLLFLKELMKSQDISYLWDLSDKTLANNQNTNNYLVINEEDKRIGYLNLSEPTDAFYGKTVSLYYAIIESFRGREYGKKTVEEASEWLFNEKEIDCIVAQADVENIHSIRTLTKAGMDLVNKGEEYTTFIQRRNR